MKDHVTAVQSKIEVQGQQSRSHRLANIKSWNLLSGLRDWVLYYDGFSDQDTVIVEIMLVYFIQD